MRRDDMKAAQSQNGPEHVSSDTATSGAEPSAADISRWCWQSPTNVATGKVPGDVWWADNDKFPSAPIALGHHLGQADWKGWRILADLRSGRRVELTREPAAITKAGGQS